MEREYSLVDVRELNVEEAILPNVSNLNTLDTLKGNFHLLTVFSYSDISSCQLQKFPIPLSIKSCTGFMFVNGTRSVLFRAQRECNTSSQVFKKQRKFYKMPARQGSRERYSLTQLCILQRLSSTDSASLEHQREERLF